MKKIVIILTLLLITGCSQKMIITEQIININYDRYEIQTDDYSEILKKLKEIDFYCGKETQYIDKTLSISTTNSVINFSLSNHYYMEYQKDNKYCYTKDQEKVKNLVFLLDGIIKRYTSNDFFSIEFIENYEENNEDNNIRLDKGNEYVLIKLNEQITNFKINEIEFQDDHFEEINLIYNKEIIESNNIVIRKSIDNTPNYKISFTNKYGFTFNIIPIYDGITNNVVFEIEVK